MYFFSYFIFENIIYLIVYSIECESYRKNIYMSKICEMS